ncbi:MAG: hypothetical protein LBH48_00465 [Bifidobacteriaceae bacterium]|nr:hypothetical protein [Bifidobacteriaceae bacterium]
MGVTLLAGLVFGVLVPVREGFDQVAWAGLAPGAAYAARIGVLAVWAALGFAAIRVYPFAKWGMAGLLLLPTFILPAVYPLPAVIQAGGTALLLATVLNLRAHPAGRRLRWWEAYALVVLAGAVSIVRPSGALLGLLILAVPAARLGRLGQRGSLSRISAAWPVKAIPLGLGVWTLVRWWQAVDLSPGGQLDFMLHHPGFALGVLPRYIWSQAAGVHSTLAQLSPAAGLPNLAIFGIFLAVAVYSCCSSKALPKAPGRAWLLLLALAYFAAVGYAAYIDATEVASRSIFGIDGADQLVVLILLLPLCQGAGRLRRQVYLGIVRYMPLLLLAATLLTLLTTYTTSILTRVLTP